MTKRDVEMDSKSRSEGGFRWKGGWIFSAKKMTAKLRTQMEDKSTMEEYREKKKDKKSEGRRGIKGT